MTFPGGSEGKEPACSVEDPGSIPGSGRSPGEGTGNPLQYSCLENPMDGGAWQPTASTWGCEELDRTERLTQCTSYIQILDYVENWCLSSLYCSVSSAKAKDKGYM